MFQGACGDHQVGAVVAEAVAERRVQTLGRLATASSRRADDWAESCQAMRSIQTASSPAKFGFWRESAELKVVRSAFR